MRDFLTPRQRSERMARVRSSNTQLEVRVAEILRMVGLKFRRYTSRLPGRPDFILANGAVALFVDSDFWHGWRYPAWKSRLSASWRAKIGATRMRDRRITRRLRRMGVAVVRVWEHDLKKNLDATVEKLKSHPTIASTITAHPRRGTEDKVGLCPANPPTAAASSPGSRPRRAQ